MPSSTTAAVALGLAPPLDRAEWGADQKDGQNNQWRKDQGENKGHKEPATAIDAADSSQGADDHVKYHFEHGPALVNSPSRASPEALFDDIGAPQLDGLERVILVGSFSKTLSGALSTL